MLFLYLSFISRFSFAEVLQEEITRLKNSANESQDVVSLMDSVSSLKLENAEMKRTVQELEEKNSKFEAGQR